MDELAVIPLTACAMRITTKAVISPGRSRVFYGKTCSNSFTSTMSRSRHLGCPEMDLAVAGSPLRLEKLKTPPPNPSCSLV